MTVYARTPKFICIHDKGQKWQLSNHDIENIFVQPYVCNHFYIYAIVSQNARPHDQREFTPDFHCWFMPSVTSSDSFSVIRCDNLFDETDLNCCRSRTELNNLVSSTLIHFRSFYRICPYVYRDEVLICNTLVSLTICLFSIHIHRYTHLLIACKPRNIKHTVLNLDNMKNNIVTLIKEELSVTFSLVK